MSNYPDYDYEFKDIDERISSLEHTISLLMDERDRLLAKVREYEPNYGLDIL